MKRSLPFPMKPVEVCPTCGSRTLHTNQEGEKFCSREKCSKPKSNPKPATPMQTKEITHPELVAALAKPGQKIADELTGEDAHLLHMAVGISGESGELLDAVKKAAIYRKEIDRQNVIEELGDLEFYMEGLRAKLGITREETLKANIAKLSQRYESLAYSDKAAQDRADKEEGQ